MNGGIWLRYPLQSGALLFIGWCSPSKDIQYPSKNLTSKTARLSLGHGFVLVKSSVMDMWRKAATRSNFTRVQWHTDIKHHQKESNRNIDYSGFTFVSQIIPDHASICGPWVYFVWSGAWCSSGATPLSSHKEPFKILKTGFGRKKNTVSLIPQ